MQSTEREEPLWRENSVGVNSILRNGPFSMLVIYLYADIQIQSQSKKLNYKAKLSSKTNWGEKSIFEICYSKVQWSFCHVIFNVYEYVLLPSHLSIFFLHMFNVVPLSHYFTQFGTLICVLTAWSVLWWSRLNWEEIW